MLALILCSAGAGVVLAAGTYYVDGSSPGCSDAGPGTEAQPYCTISAAVAARGGPGTLLLVKPGVYREQVAVSASGTAGSPLVLRAVGGPVTVDGADDRSGTANWMPSSGDVWVAAGVTWSPLQVFADGARLTPSTAAPSSLPPGAFTWVSGQGLYVNLGGGNPGARELRVGRRLHGFRISGRSHVTIEGFTVTRTEDRGIYLLNGCSSVTVRSCVVTFANRMGLQAAGGSALVIEGNVTSDNNDHGIALTAGATGSLVRDNESFGNANPAVRAANGIHLYGATGNLLERNRVHHNQDTGLHLAGGSNDCISIQNRSWSNGDHGFDHLFTTGTLDVGNVAYGNHKDGFSIEGGSAGTRLYNCIGVDNGLTTGEFDLWVDLESTPGFVSDHNIFWNSTATPPFKYIATTYTTIEAYRAASGQDARSLQADPRFVDPGGGDFHLRAGSPAIDAGDSGVPGWPASDAEGNARADDPATPNTGAGPVAFAERGALEFPPPADQPPVVTAPATAEAGEGQLLSVNVTAADPDGDPIASLTVSGLPAGATFVAGPGNTSGTLSWTPGFDQAGSYAVTFTAANARSESTTTVIAVSNVDRPPSASAPATATGWEGRAITVTVTAVDPDGEAITSLTAVMTPAFPAENRPPPDSGPGSGTLVGAEADPAVAAATGFQEGATFTAGPGNVTGTLSWTPAFDQAGSYTVRFTAANDLSGAASTTITVRNVDRSPVVTVPATVTASMQVPVTVNVTAADPDGDAIHSLTASGLPAGASFVAGPGNTTGTLSWTPAPGDAGSHRVTITAVNARAGLASTVITVASSDRAPVVSAPATAGGTENAPLTVQVTASDPDGDAITSLTATGLPAGASFTAGPGNTSGTLSWTPGYQQAGSHTVTFAAANAQSGAASTVITVANLDRAPLVSAPATASVAEGSLLTVAVTAGDPDGEAIVSLAASGLPAGAIFTAGPGNTSGTLSWTPGYEQAGGYTVSFTAANALSGAASTAVTVQNVNPPPVASLVVTPATGNAPLAVVADASGSADLGGAIASYRFDFGDGTVVGPQPSPSAAHTYGAGSWTAGVTVTDNEGATHTTSRGVLVAVVPPEPNLVGNPSFETGTAGWGASSGATLARVPGGFDGAFALRVSGPASTASFQADDTPNWVASTAAAGVTYRFSAWVRAATGAGSVRLRVREYVGGSSSGGPRQSNAVTLSSTWQLVTVDLVTRNAGSTLDFLIICSPAGPSEAFLADNISIRRVGAAAQGTAASGSGDASPEDPGDPVRAAGEEQTGLVPSLVRGHATLGFRMAAPGPFEVDLLDLAGRRVRRLARASDAPAGPYRLTVDGRGDQGERLAPGVYFYSVRMPDRVETGRFVILP